MPKDRITQLHQGYGFVEFLGEEDADYAIKVMNMIKVYGKPIRVNKVGFTSLHFSFIVPPHIWYNCTAVVCIFRLRSLWSDLAVVVLRGFKVFQRVLIPLIALILQI